jgi:hypothetical protein
MTLTTGIILGIIAIGIGFAIYKTKQKSSNNTNGGGDGSPPYQQ